MKSRAIIWLALMAAVPSVQVSAQVLPLGRVPQRGRVQPASCQSCAESSGGVYRGSGGFYGGTVWGTECFDCSGKPGLFPPCPNPCQTTLLGELVYDVKTAVDGTLSHVFGCLFGYPCGCHGVCTCAETVWDTCGSGCSCGACGAGAMPEMSSTFQAVPADGDFEGDPFGDDPMPTPALQPVPSGSTTRSLLPGPRTSAKQVRRQPSARQVSHEVPVAESRTNSDSRPAALQPVAAQPLRPAAAAQHYQPRRAASLRRANGQTLERSPLQQNGSQPALRFRSTE